MNAPNDRLPNQESPEQTRTAEGETTASKQDGQKAIGFLRKKPGLAAVMAGGVGFVAANVIGVGELAIALAAGYAAYRALTS